MAQRSPVGDVHGPGNRTRAGVIVEEGRRKRGRREGGRRRGAAGSAASITPLSQHHPRRRVSQKATARRGGKGGSDGAWVAVHWRPSPPRSGESARTMTVDHTTESKNPTTRSEKVWFPGKGRQGRGAYALYSPHQARQVPSQVKTWTET